MAKFYFKQEGSLVKLFLDSPDEKVNSISGKITLSDGSRVAQVQEANSAISFWVEKPTIATDEITFSGIIPGGFQGTGAQILSFSWQTRTEQTEVVLVNPRVLLHDGLGTETQVIVSPLVVSFPKDDVVGADDTIPPEVFQPIISSDPLIFGGQKFLSFQTQDKQTGINHYEVKEGGSEWQGSESPYLLVNQELNTKILVKAVDLAGNERVVAAFSPSHWYNNFWLWLIIGVAILCLALSKRFLFRSSS